MGCHKARPSRNTAWAVAIDWLLWHTLPDRYTMLGAAIIIGSGIYLVRHEKVHAECEHP